MPTLNDINYLKFSPQELLGDYVQAIWFAHNPNNQGELAFKLLSDCGSCIIMNFSNELSLKRNGQDNKVGHQAVVVGPSKDLFHITFIDQVNTLGINFHPGTGHVFLEGGIEPLIDSIEICTDRVFADINALYNGIAEGELLDAKERLFKQVETILKQYLERYLKQAQFKFETLLNKLKQNDDMPIDALSDVSGFSKREVQRKFKQFIGISPNVYQRIIKLNKIKERLSKGEFENLTQLAIDNGYYDQAHFIRDFKYFMQLTPKAYFRLKQND